MASWHQRQAMRGKVWQPSKWTVVSDPPNEMRTHMTFPDKAAAEEALRQWQARGERYVYIVGPVA